MIPKTLLLAFLSLQGTIEPQAPERGAALSNIAQLDVVNELTATLHDARAEIDEAINEIEFFTGPSVQKSANHQVPFAIPSGQGAVAGSDVKQINFTNGEVPDTDGFKILNRDPEVIYTLDQAFPDILAPPGIKKAWSPGPFSKHHGLFAFSFGAAVHDVQVQFGWIENDKLNKGNYTITGHLIGGSVKKSDIFPEGHWIDTLPLNNALYYELNIEQKALDLYVVVTRVYYRLGGT